MGIKNSIQSFNSDLIKSAATTDSMVDPTAFMYMENAIDDFVSQMSLKKEGVVRSVVEKLSDKKSDGHNPYISSNCKSWAIPIDGYESFVMKYDDDSYILCFINDLEFHIREMPVDTSENIKSPPTYWSSLIEKKNKSDQGYVLSVIKKHTKEEINKLIFAIENNTYDEKSIEMVNSTINNNSHNFGVNNLGKIKSAFLDINSVFVNLLQNG